MSDAKPTSVSRTSIGSNISPRLLLIVVALTLVVIIVGIIPFLGQLSTPKASVNLSNLSETVTGCGTGGGSPNYYTYAWTFTLTNNGNTNANATIAVVATSAVYSGASPLTSKVFTVPKGTQTPESFSYSPTQLDCQKVDLTLQLQSTT